MSPQSRQGMTENVGGLRTFGLIDKEMCLSKTFQVSNKDLLAEMNFFV